MSKKSKGDSHQKPKKEVSRKRTKASLTIIKTRKKKHYDKSNYAQIEIKPCLKINQQKQKPKYYRYQQKYLKKVETEKFLFPQPNYIENQNGFKKNHRSITIDWMNEFVDHTGLTSDVLYHSVYLFDQFLSKENTLLTNLQITGLICVLISSKTLKNITMGSLTIDEIYLETGGLFSKKEMDEMEKKILKTFGSNIKSKINSKYFLKYFIDVLGNKEKLYHLSSYICELSLLSYTIYTRFRPSEIAFSSIILSFYILGKNTIPVELQQFSLIDIKSKKINLLISLLNQIYIKASTIKKSPFSKKKYSKKNRLEVSLIKPPQIFIPTNNEN